MAAKRLQIGCDWLQIDCKTAALRLQLQLKCSHVAAMGLQYLQNDFIDFIVWLRCGCMVCKMTSLLGCVVAAKSANWLHCYNEANLQRYCSDIAAILQPFAVILQRFCSQIAALQLLSRMQPNCIQCSLFAVVGLANLQVACVSNPRDKKRVQWLLRKKRLLRLCTSIINLIKY